MSPERGWRGKADTFNRIPIGADELYRTEDLNSIQVGVNIVGSDVELVRTEEFPRSKLITLYRLISSRSTVLAVEEFALPGVHQHGVGVGTFTADVGVVNAVAG